MKADYFALTSATLTLSPGFLFKSRYRLRQRTTENLLLWRLITAMKNIEDLVFEVWDSFDKGNSLNSALKVSTLASGMG